MLQWNAKIKIKHLLTDDEDHESTQNNMNNIADALESSGLFYGFDTSGFRNIPKGDNFFSPTDYANVLLDKMYDYADYRRIWIE